MPTTQHQAPIQMVGIALNAVYGIYCGARYIRHAAVKRLKANNLSNGKCW